MQKQNGFEVNKFYMNQRTGKAVQCLDVNEETVLFRSMSTDIKNGHDLNTGLTHKFRLYLCQCENYKEIEPRLIECTVIPQLSFAFTNV